MIKYLDEYRDSDLATKLVDKIKSSNFPKKLKIMEVCGTHTMSISRFGIRQALKEKIELISGPGCPVCVTPTSYIDKAVEYSKNERNIITTFGDMFRVPGSKSTLEKEKSDGANIKVVYSPLDSIKIALDNPDKNVIFLSVGFETTTPTVAGMIQLADNQRIMNLFVLCANKLVPPALKVILEDKEIQVDGFLMPAHVSTMIGYEPYRFVVNEYGIPSVIAGFEALDILAAITMLIRQFNAKSSALENEYKRFAKSQGNKKAISLMNELFEPVNAIWRGFSIIPDSGLKLRRKYSHMDIEEVQPVKVDEIPEPKGCLCADIVKGKGKPIECRLFGKKCTPQNPVGACMVSSEGTCAAYYKYER